MILVSLRGERVWWALVSISDSGPRHLFIERYVTYIVARFTGTRQCAKAIFTFPERFSDDYDSNAGRLKIRPLEPTRRFYKWV